jgi:hypothetical protein
MLECKPGTWALTGWFVAPWKDKTDRKPDADAQEEDGNGQQHDEGQR